MSAVIRTNFYAGETKNQLRDGIGIYYYANKFFRYEGDWFKGKKHGHGKLIMADGSYYEGEFKEGEIEGHGFRKWQQSGNSYSGEFHFGEMHGHGVLNYANGSQYKGEFSSNCRHGNGVYRDEHGNEYEGFWYNNRQSGHGILTFKNGDVYEGDFVKGNRQGHGLMRFADGGFYEGQWHADVFSGEGKISHCSGISYSGLWLNGEPALIAKEIAPADSTTGNHCLQGQAFNLKLQLLDRSGNILIEECGRKFEISAGFKYVPQSKSNQSLLELIEDIEEKPISTPFGYDILSYPIVELEPYSGKDDMTSKVIRQSSESLPNVSEVSESKSHEDKSDSEIKDESLLIKQPSITDSTVSVESRSWHNLTTPTRTVYNGTLGFDNLFLPYVPPNNKVPDDAKSKRSKGSRTASAVSSSSSEGKIVTSKQKVSSEKGANPGEYVIIVKEITEPPFLGNRLEIFFTTVTVSAPKQLRKSKTKVAGN
ncbi:MORN repeat-containing protein 1-like [Styela clava]